MGTPAQALKHRGDNKLYRLQTPQSPLVRPTAHDELAIDNYAVGTNAVVAVISYTVSLYTQHNRGDTKANGLERSPVLVLRSVLRNS